MIQIDVPMPKTCGDCRFADSAREYPFCTVLQQDRGYPFDVTKKKFPNCPLKPIEPPKEDSETDKLKNLCRVLFNRCRAVGSCNGLMCTYCGMRTECDEMSSVGKENWNGNLSTD